MTDTPLIPATSEEIADALMHALRYDGRRRVHDADELMAFLVAERLVSHLQRCGFRLMRVQNLALPDTSYHRHPNADRSREGA
ncbi:hypothetical protein AA23498_3615 [Acetobacter nitrogenifigens DSM 23921 = NBRC 105050]|uniref:Uncharacterized protein n=1 Tax=Acetobacter nitrogenifigens DSM 23921 = NBRC 105050 TaxID=1120919 RepID=A0A511XF23_9PROT|nr:hypothetical protein [Acetobacter nitrogenifigens]GBR00118.1 hypothetical protein AA23498_3615 [Acetobacter nitrogenifigens DSM 23921 = NBRC 105050]GEN61549.1 hypothetical protein ANI02nite_34330 [Acetobacter nitrogenifigens DSM 23921 = NBRC 105050]